MRAYGEHDESFVATLNKGAMACGEDALFNAGGVDIGTILRLKWFSESVRKFLKSRGVAFRLTKGKVVSTRVGKQFSDLIERGCGDINSVYMLEPYSQLIMDSIDWPSVSGLLRGVDKWEDCEQVMNTLNSIADRVRERAHTSEFKARVNSYHRSANKNYRELVKYERALFDSYSRMLIIRVDLYYRKEHCKVAQRVALEHRKRLFENARSNKIFKHMLGYVTKLEHGVERGFHFHCLFFFDGARVREDINLAMRVGEYWVTVITRGKGGYYNCNYAKEKYRRCGIGMVSHSNAEMREGLRLAMIYIAKTDIFLKLKAEGRALTRGIMPAARSGRGRPRVIDIS